MNSYLVNFEMLWSVEVLFLSKGFFNEDRFIFCNELIKKLINKKEFFLELV